MKDLKCVNLIFKYGFVLTRKTWPTSTRTRRWTCSEICLISPQLITLTYQKYTFLASPEIRSWEPGASLFIKVAPGSQNFTWTRSNFGRTRSKLKIQKFPKNWKPDHKSGALTVNWWARERPQAWKRGVMTAAHPHTPFLMWVSSPGKNQG